MTPKQSPKTETKTVSEARKTFSETLNRVYRGEARVLVEKNGIPVGGIVSAGDLERLRALDEKSSRAIEAFEAIQACLVDVPEDELERELEKAMAEAKDIRRQERELAAKKSA